MHPENPIGVFDSGVGGLSVLHEIRKLLPYENLIYVADSAHAPYGDKPKEFILKRSTAIVEFFLSQNVKALVVACNTATAAAVKELRHKYDLPMVAMEPAIKPAAEQTNTGVIGVLATHRTIHSNNFKILFERFAAQVKIIPQACPGLVERVEQGDLNSTEIRGLVSQYVEPLIAQKADILVLGCTHYPFLAPLIKEIAGTQIKVIDSGIAIARQLRSLLGNHDLLATKQYQGMEQFWCSSENREIYEVIAGLWGNNVTVAKFPDPVAV